jgi:hypothetical protein
MAIIKMFKVSVSVCFVSVGQFTQVSTEVVNERNVVFVEADNAHCLTLLPVE